MSKSSNSTKSREPEPWERQPGETPKAFEAFQLYRDMGASRSTSAVGRQLHKHRDLICRWSRRYGWVKRVASWDDEQDRLRRKKLEGELEEMAERHAKIALMMQDKIAAQLEHMNKSSKTKPIPVTVLHHWTDTAVRIERLARGQATERMETRELNTWQDLMEYDDDDENAED